MAAERYRAVVVPHTHWDREWYEPFEVFRARLVDVVDQVLDLLTHDPRYPSFMLDGQAVVLEDYLAIRPERADTIRSLVGDGKLAIGPWYVLADEFLVSPEALIRNLARGRKVCAAFGGAMPDAYTPDSFGHISQLPLLVAGFGLDAVVFERGVGDEGERIGGEFCWVAADGLTRSFAVHLLGTYSSAAGLGHADWELRDPFDRDRAVQQLRAAIFGTEGLELDELAGWLRTSFASVPGGMAAYATGNTLLLLNGSDHLFPQADLRAILDQVGPGLPEVDLRIGLLGDYLQAVRQPIDQLARFQGEFRSSRYHHCLYGVLSARMPIKQANHRAQVLLEHYAEPATALAWAQGEPHPTALLDEAWRLLLLNHPHDSICGCSIDAVHDEMMTRFTKVEQLGRDLLRRALGSSSGTVTTQGTLVFNPSPWRRREAVEVELEAAAGSGAGLRVRDGQGRPVPSQASVTRRLAPGSSTVWQDHVRLRFLAEVDGLGTRAYRVDTEAATAGGGEPAAATASSAATSAAAMSSTATSSTAASATAPAATAPAATAASAVAPAANGSTTAALGARANLASLENEHLAVSYQAGGLHLLDKRNGRWRALDLRFEDVADRGDSYDFSALPGDRAVVVDRPSTDPVVSEAGPVRASWTLRYDMDVPSRLSEDRQQRVGGARLPIQVELSLTAGQTWLELAVALDNVAEDHRLRLVVPTAHRSEEVWADGHFDVLRRSVRPVSGEGWRQPPVAASHQRRFVMVADAEAGLALLNRGLPEYEARQGPDGVELHVTLLRCFGWLSRDDIAERRLESAGPQLPTPGGQCPGAHRFELALFPFDGDAWSSGLGRAAQAFTAPLYPQPIDPAAAPEPGAYLELLGTDGNGSTLELSCLKRAEAGDGLVVRVWNPAPVAMSASLRFALPVRKVTETDLSEEPLAQTVTLRATEDGGLPLTLGPKQVRTFVVAVQRKEER